MLGSLQGFGQVQTPRAFNDPSNPNVKGFYEYLPAGYTPGSGKKYPLIIFCHGKEELASTSPLSAVLNNGLPKVINQGLFPTSFTVNGQQFSFIVISPQFNTWAGTSDVVKFKDYLLTKYDIDVNRIYVTGLSMGGAETWDALSINATAAKAWAAATVVCGATPPTIALAATVAGNNTPVWAFHNNLDDNVPSEWSVNWVKDINATIPAPNPLARVTIFNASGHDSWTKAYDPNYKEDGKNMYEWMLQYSKGSTGTPPVTGNKRIVVPMTNTANGRAEMYYVDAMKSLNVTPGDTLCIPAGEYEYLYLGNLVGTAAKPIVITNCGGQVKLGVKNRETAAAFNAASCRFVEISGSGDPNYEYGFDLNATNINGLRIFGMAINVGASDFDVHNIYIHDGDILLQAKTLQSCAQPQYLEGAFVMKNVKIHHIKGRNSLSEGFYIGNTHYFWDDGTCKNLRSHWIENISIYDNDLENLGWDGIQVSMAKNGDNRVYNNRVVNYGMSKNSAQGYGILVGSGSSLKVYNNFVSKGYMPGITVFGSGVNEIYNNVISNITFEGINVTDKIPDNTTPALFPPPAAIIYNNTIVNADSGKNAIKIYAYLTTIGHQVYNNLMVQKGTPYDYPEKGLYIRGAQPIKFLYGNDSCYKDISTAKMVDSASQNYRLLATSTAVNAGRDMTDFSLYTDFDNTARPQQGKYDVGAFEFKGGTPTNQPPVAKAGNNVTITLPVNTVALDGSASTAAAGSTITGYAWKKISGPASGNIVSASTAKTNVTDLSAGTYVFELTVTDNRSLSGSARVTITVQPAANKPPVANAGTNTQIRLPVNNTSLDGSASTDPDGQIVTWLWTKTAGPAGGDLSAAAAAKTNVSNLLAGTYTYQLKVTDNGGATNTATVNVVVLAANKLPVANAGKNIQIQLPVNTASLDGSNSSDPDGQIVTWLWQKTAGPNGGDLAANDAAKTNVSNLLAGTYTYRLTVTDNDGGSNTATVNVVVLPASPNQFPVADAGNDVQVQLPVNTASLDGSTSKDADGQIVTWLWTKTAGPAGGDLSASGAAKTNVSNLLAGTYTYQLTVTDNEGASSTSTVNVVVLAANKLPVANAGQNIQIQLPVNTAALDGSNSSDPNGQIVAWLWQKTAGPDGGDLANSDAAKTNVSNLLAGTYTYRLTVTDNDGGSNTASVNVVVLPATPNQLPVANAGNEVRVQLPVNTASLDGSASSDPDGQIVTWFWKKTAGPAGGDIAATGAAQTNVSNLQEGTYTYQLTVTDNAGATSTASVNVIVLPANNKKPVAVTGVDRTIQLPSDGLFADGSESYDTDGTITQYAWTQLSGPSDAGILNPDKSQTFIRNLVAGKYEFQLTVTDNKQATGTAIFTVTVIARSTDAHVVDSVKLYPNPAVSYIRLDVTRKGITPLQVRIFDMNGRLSKNILYTTPDSFKADINISGLGNGHYLLEVKAADDTFRWKGHFIKIQ